MATYRLPPRLFRPSFFLKKGVCRQPKTSTRVSMGLWHLRLSAKLLALLRLSVNFFLLRLTKKLKINFFCFKKLNIN